MKINAFKIQLQHVLLKMTVGNLRKDVFEPQTATEVVCSCFAGSARFYSFQRVAKLSFLQRDVYNEKSKNRKTALAPKFCFVYF